jgi:S1-C subfamily serine protease
VIRTALRVFLILACTPVSMRSAGGQSQGSVAPTTVDKIREMRSAIVQIRYFDPATAADSRAGTGFLVGRQGYVITAGHVIRDVPTGTVVQVGILLDPSSNPHAHFRGSFVWGDVLVVDDDLAHDVSLLKLSRNPFAGELASGILIGKEMLHLKVSATRLDSRLPEEGENLLVSGYPLQIPTLVTQKGMVASESFATINISAAHRVPEVVDSILLDAVINPGNSGGPVYRPESLDVVGICQAYEDSPVFTETRQTVRTNAGESVIQNSGLAVVIPIKYAIDLLRKNGVSDFASTPHPSSHASKPR